MKRLLCGLMALGLFFDWAGFAKADYLITTLDVPNSTSTYANGINDLGQIVGSYADVAKLTGRSFLPEQRHLHHVRPTRRAFKRCQQHQLLGPDRGRE
jgi:hypothetical protein